MMRSKDCKHGSAIRDVKAAASVTEKECVVRGKTRNAELVKEREKLNSSGGG
jgi:hypothetical protein